MEQKEINTNTLRQWLDSGKNVNVLDIRPTHEREEWYIPGSIHIDAYAELNKNNPNALEAINFDKSIPVVTVCAGGKTSMIAARLLHDSGYDSYNLKGGMKAWSLSWNTAQLSFDRFELVQFRRTGKGCLSYMIISGQEAMVVDASLPVKVYRDFIENQNLVLKYVMDTHVHADHLSRAKELAESFGLKPSIPKNDKLVYPFHSISDKTIFEVGEIQVKAIHTPGHTLESTSYHVDDKALLTGDTLFTNGVGRPDLKANEEEARDKAMLLYLSLKKLIELDSNVVILPGHTNQPIEFDGKPIKSNIGEVLQNVPLLHQVEDVFIQTLLSRIPATPANYLTIVEKNLKGDFADINPIDLEAGANRCAVS